MRLVANTALRTLPPALAGALFLNLGLARAEEASVPELRQRASITAVDGLVLFRPGQLLVGNPTVQGRPAIEPLDPDAVSQVPESLDDYEVLSHGCVREPEQAQEPAVISGEVLVRGDMGGDGRLEQVRVQRRAPMAAPEVLVSRDGTLVGRGVLPVPAVPCRGLVAEAEPEGAPVLMVVWTSRGASSTTVGVTVFEIDEPVPEPATALD